MSKNDERYVISLRLKWSEVALLLEEVRTATTAIPHFEEDEAIKGFELHGYDGKVYLVANTSDGIHNSTLKKGESARRVFAYNFDPMEIEDSSFWENPLFPIMGDDTLALFSLGEIEHLLEDSPSRLLKNPSI